MKEDAMESKLEQIGQWEARTPEALSRALQSMIDAITARGGVVLLGARHLGDMRAIVEEMRTVLEWYANESSYNYVRGPGPGDFGLRPIDQDRGIQARIALRKG
jgi:hypothetical protein